MTRRDLLKIAATVPMAPLGTLAKLALLTEVRYVEHFDDPDLIGWESIKFVAECEFCEQNFVDDICDHVPIRKFYVASDGDYVVCEHCIPKFLADSPAARAAT